MSASPAKLDAQLPEYPALAPRAELMPRSAVLHASEYVLLIYFGYTTILAFAWHLPLSVRVLAIVTPCSLAALAAWETWSGTKATGIFREWISPAMVLFAYEEVDWFAQAHTSYVKDNRWVVWDRLVLDHWHFRAFIESLGWIVPFYLELSYLLVYAIPPLALGILYWSGRRNRVDNFLFTFLLGTLLAYALLPYFPSDPPRFVFPGQDLPSIGTAPRRLNLWLLDRYDIRTSVFPSGHVAAAFSAAFGMLLAFPEKKRIGAMLLVLATVIAVATVYGRYHFAVDGLAGLSVSLAAAGISSVFFQLRRS
jgi:membrane-associated phospholipid phosphatase